MEIAAYHPSGIFNSEMASGFLENLCTPALLVLGLLLYAYLFAVICVLRR
jgi:hypothetical protein